MRDEQLLAYLKGSCSGRKNRVGGATLERTLHVSGTDLRKLVNQLRRKTHRQRPQWLLLRHNCR